MYCLTSIQVDGISAIKACVYVYGYLCGKAVTFYNETMIFRNLQSIFNINSLRSYKINGIQVNKRKIDVNVANLFIVLIN